MRGWQLNEILQRDWRVRRVFRGVFASDSLPRYIEQGIPHAFIINIDRNNKPGSHWVALYIDAFGTATYFDSFGFPPYQPDIKNFIERNSYKLKNNPIIIQNIFATTCGLYCVYFVREMVKGKRLIDIISHFHPRHTTMNDRRITQLVLEQNR